MQGIPKLSLVEGSFEELALEFATYIDGLRGDGSTLASEVQPLLADVEQTEGAKPTDKEAVLKKLVTASSVLKSAPEKELQAAYNLLIHLISQANNPNIYLPPICKYLSSPITSSPQNGTGIALGILGTLFNSIPPDDDTRQHVLLAIVEMVKNSKNYDTLQPQLKNLDSWIEQWELEPEEARTVYLSIADAASAANESEDSYAYLLKALRTLQNAPSSQEARDLSIRALKTALENEKHFDFEDLTTLDSIQALRQTDQTWSDILQLFSADNYDDMQDFKESNPTFCSDNGLDEEVLDRKMRLLTIASLSAQATHTSRTLAYSTIAKALAIPSVDVEVWIIDSIRSGLVEGKLSQQNQEFLIHRSTYRVFGENQWREVASRLETWKTSLISVLGVIRAQKEDFVREKEAELNGPPATARDGFGYRPDRRQRNQGLAVEAE